LARPFKQEFKMIAPREARRRLEAMEARARENEEGLSARSYGGSVSLMVVIEADEPPRYFLSGVSVQKHIAIGVIETYGS
jgi:hypothetical protein